MYYAPHRPMIFFLLERGKGDLNVFNKFLGPFKNSKFSISFSMCEIWLMFSIKVVLYMSLHIEFLFCNQQSIWTICIQNVLFWVEGVVSDFFPFWGHGWPFLLLGSHHFFFFISLWLKIWLRIMCFLKASTTEKGKRKLKRTKNFWRVNITICVGWYKIPKKLCLSLFIL